MPEADQGPVVVEELWSGMQVDVGPVGHIEAQLFGLKGDGELVPDEVGRA